MSYELTAHQQASLSVVNTFVNAVKDDKNPALAEQAFISIASLSNGRNMAEKSGAALYAIARVLTGAAYQSTQSSDTLLEDIDNISPMARKAIENASRKLSFS